MTLDKIALDRYLTREPDDCGFSNWCEKIYELLPDDFDFDWLDGDEGNQCLSDYHCKDYTPEQVVAILKEKIYNEKNKKSK